MWETTKDKVLVWGVVFLSLLPWFVLRTQQTVHPDILWLYEAMSRILHGGSMAETSFETNPPLSLILYAVPVLLKDAFGWPLHITGLIQSFAIFAAGTGMLCRILSNFTSLDAAQRNLILLGFVFLNTVSATIVFGERDHLIAMILPAFVLLQLSLTYGLGDKSASRGKLAWAFCILSAFLILLKPHHGLIPSLLLVHRVLTRRSLSALKDPDFIALAVMTLAYGALVYFYFPDYLSTVLPDVMAYYLPGHTDIDSALTLTMFGVSLALLGGLSWYLVPAGQERYLFIFFCGCAALSLIPVIVQGKWIPYHFFPTAVFIACAAPRLLHHFISLEIRKPRTAMILTLSSVIVIAYLTAPLDFHYARHANYKNLPMAQMIVKYTDKSPHKSYFFFNCDISMIHEPGYYLDLKHASRFPSLWFLPGLYFYKSELDDGNLTDQEAAHVKAEIDQYGRMIGEDLDRYKPAVAIMIDPDFFKNRMDPIEFFSGNAVFKAAWSHYKPAGKIEILESDYYGNAVKRQEPKIYYLYERNP